MREGALLAVAQRTDRSPAWAEHQPVLSWKPGRRSCRKSI